MMPIAQQSGGMGTTSIRWYSLYNTVQRYSCSSTVKKISTLGMAYYKRSTRRSGCFSSRVISAGGVRTHMLLFDTADNVCFSVADWLR